MIDSFYVAWRYLSFNWARGLRLIACVTLIAQFDEPLVRALFIR